MRGEALLTLLPPPQAAAARAAVASKSEVRVER
jgi:hypothetical protein